MLAVWRATCHAFYSVVSTHLRRRYDTHVTPFVSNVPLFNDVLRAHAAIISGSVALHFFHPGDHWEPHDMDIYVADANWRTFLSAIQDPNGLNFTRYDPFAKKTSEGTTSSSSSGSTTSDSADDDAPNNEDTDDTGEESDSDSTRSYGSDDSGEAQPLHVLKGLRDVRTFTTPTGARVDVIRSPSNSPLTPLRFFWSSLVVNFITPDGCGCGYPSSTLHRIGVLKPGLFRLRDKNAVAKYEGRCFDFVSQEWRQVLDMWDYLFLERGARWFLTSVKNSHRHARPFRYDSACAVGYQPSIPPCDLPVSNRRKLFLLTAFVANVLPRLKGTIFVHVL